MQINYPGFQNWRFGAIVPFCVSLLAVTGCQVSESNGLSKEQSEALEDKAYQELMALESPAALAKYSVHGGDSAAVANMIRCDINGSVGDSTSYNFKMINTQLEFAPSVGRLIGYQRVSDCEGAHKFVEKKYALIESRPSQEMLQDSLNAEQAGVFEKSSIQKGVDENSAGEVLIRYPSNRICTGSIIAPRVILTAAHCLSGELIYNGVQPTSGIVYATIWYYPPSMPSPQRIRIAQGDMHLVMHPTYAGGADTQSDIGLIILENPLPTTDFLRLYVGTMANGRRNNIYGAGVNSNDRTGAEIMRRGSEYVDWYGTHYYYATESGGTRTCGGDSGGPWVRIDATLDLITGVHSNSDRPDNYLCTGPGGRMRAVRVNTKLPWISAQIHAYGAGSCTISGDIAQCF